MNIIDVVSVIKWWIVFAGIGIIFLPLASLIFSRFVDRGYIFSKVLGIGLISYIVFILGMAKILPFNAQSILIVCGIFTVINIFISIKYNLLILLKKHWKFFLIEEILFLSGIFFWSYIRAHLPDINGLEKYMDFGFVNSIIRSEYFPPKDMWFTPHPINYYYFGHLITAMLTKISTIPSNITYNLMLSTLFAFTFTCSFSISINLLSTFKNHFSNLRIAIAGLLTGFFVSMGGNLHTIYSFFKAYAFENPVPFWELQFAIGTFPNGYWYPNATRFIHNTIHEFPIYSFVVSDLHGHVLDIPFVLLTIAVLFSLLIIFTNNNSADQNPKINIFNFKIQILTFKFGLFIILLSFLLSIMYMTNAWDGMIYFLLTVVVISIFQLKMKIKNYDFKSIKSYFLNLTKSKKYFIHTGISIIAVLALFFIFTFPFNANFKPFASGIGILCAPQFLTNIETLGPFLFEKDHCQHSLWWQIIILYGFFYFWAFSFLFFIFNKKNSRKNYADLLHKGRFKNHKIQRYSSKQKISNNLKGEKNENLNIFGVSLSNFFILLLIIFSTFLIILPEFVYVKDIYPGHYRANTMFKLVYQAFIMLSIVSGYTIIKLNSNLKFQITTLKFLYWAIAGFLIMLVVIYPFFAINSYYAQLINYKGIDGTSYLKSLYPSDYDAIIWINENIEGQPVILEAQGDSYTEYGRVSTNTGLPTVLGWTVHEWLWRGSYDIPAPRIPEVQKMYELQDLEETKKLFKKYDISLVFVGDLEREKYTRISEDKFEKLGKIIYEKNNTRIYRIN